MNRIMRPPLVWMAISVLMMTLLPANAFCFWDEDTLKIAGITTGAVLALGILIVLIAGTMQDIKGDEDEEAFSKDGYVCSLENLLLAGSINPYQKETKPRFLGSIPLLPGLGDKDLKYVLVSAPFPTLKANDEYYVHY